MATSLRKGFCSTAGGTERARVWQRGPWRASPERVRFELPQLSGTPFYSRETRSRRAARCKSRPASSAAGTGRAARTPTHQGALHPVRLQRPPGTDRYRSAVTLTTRLHMHVRSVCMPGASPLVGDLRGVVLREHLRELVAVPHAQEPPFEGLSYHRNPLDPEPVEIKIDSIPVLPEDPTSALRDDQNLSLLMTANKPTPRVHGERRPMLRDSHENEVSTHAPRVHGERPPTTCCSVSFPAFHPTLPAFTGSDPGQPLAALVTRVSTHAPRVHGERPHPHAHPRRCGCVSTHAPRVHGERPSSSQRRPSLGGFNPRSPRSRGATTLPPVSAPSRDTFQPTLPAFTGSDHEQLCAQAPVRVSTHAPRVHGERPGASSERAAPEVSTHAPLVHRERRVWPHEHCASAGFNPRSPRSRGATASYSSPS